MLHVFHVITSLDTGGAQSMLERLLSAGSARGVESSVVSLRGGGASRARIEATGATVSDLGLNRAWPDPRALRRLAKRLSQSKPSVVQTWLYHADLVGTLAARWAGVAPVAWNLRCSVGHAKRRLSARAAPYACARFSRAPKVIITNSIAGRDSHTAIGYRPRRWELIPNGFDLKRWRPDTQARAALLTELNLAPDTLLVGMVARLHPVKDHPKALRAVRALASEYPNLRLVLVGEGLGVRDERFQGLLCSQEDFAGASERVVGLGARTDIPRLMSAFDLVLSASTHEGFPNVLGEALASGTPCLATAAGDSALVVGEAGRVVPVDDESAFVQGLGELLSRSRSERESLGALGREHIQANYALEGVLDRYVELWEELAQPCVA